MMPETRIIGGIRCYKPASVMGLESIKRIAEGTQDIDSVIKALDQEIEHRWIIDGFWRNVRLEQIYD